MPLGIAWCIVPIVYALVLATPSVTLPRDDLGFRRFQTPALASDLQLSQTFTMTANGLQAVEVSATSVGVAASGNVRLELHDVTRERNPVLMRAAEITAADLVKAFSYRFEFAPILDSRDKVYRLDFISSETRPATGVRFRATKGERYREGALHVNGEPRWADMAFRAHAPAPSIWRVLMTLRETDPIRGHLVLGAFAAIWLLAGLAVRAMARTPDTARQPAGPARRSDAVL